MKPNFDIMSKGLWYPITLSLILFVIILVMPKRLSKQEIYTTFGIIGYIVWTVDMTLGDPLDFFNVGSGKVTAVPELFLYGIIPGLIAIIFINYYNEDKKWTYIIAFTLISYLLNWLAVKVGIMKLNNWQTWYAIPIFFVVYAFVLPWHLKFIKKKTYWNTKNSH
ncbi:hypothetical protein WQ54_05500 [Bacillus sp. SA1-12]|uniref:hypothetical protein n=1 Tax=Bacillus sp. SA1-12 TaxID=1455638 RepID=UPI00062551C0|nr:hypothetical protein [Bacillus sp. SA1-12]KKI93283.1 hypothetical protein WQ54_05500 [Bacillus sp. SA1-12]